MNNLYAPYFVLHLLILFCQPGYEAQKPNKSEMFKGSSTGKTCSLWFQPYTGSIFICWPGVNHFPPYQSFQTHSTVIDQSVNQVIGAPAGLLKAPALWLFRWSSLSGGQITSQQDDRLPQWQENTH